MHSSDRQCVRVRSLKAFCLHFSVLLYIPALTNLSFSYVWWTVSLKQDLRSSTGSGLAVRGRPVCLQRVLLSKDVVQAVCGPLFLALWLVCQTATQKSEAIQSVTNNEKHPLQSVLELYILYLLIFIYWVFLSPLLLYSSPLVNQSTLDRCLHHLFLPVHSQDLGELYGTVSGVGENTSPAPVQLETLPDTFARP